MSRFSLLEPVDSGSFTENSPANSSPVPPDQTSVPAAVELYSQAKRLAHQTDLQTLLKRRELLEKCYRIYGFHFKSYCEEFGASAGPKWLFFREYLEVQVSLGECSLQIGRIYVGQEKYESILAESLFVKSVQHLKRALFMNDEAIAAEQQSIELGLTARANESMEFSHWINYFSEEIQRCQLLVQSRIEALEAELAESRSERDEVKQKIGEERWRKGPSKVQNASSYAQYRDQLMKKIQIIKSVQDNELGEANKEMPMQR